MRKIILFFIGILLPAFLSGQNASAACSAWSGAGTSDNPFVATAANAGQPEVQACINAITPSQTGHIQINIPAGNATYTGVERISVSTGVSGMANVTHLTIKGAGANNTVITNNVQSTFAYTVMYMEPGRDNIFITVSDIGFHAGTNYGQWGFIYIRRTNHAANVGWHTFRVTRCSFFNQSTGIHISGDLYGLIDNNAFIGSTNADIIASGAGIATWQRELALGGRDAIFVENNLFRRTNPAYYAVNGIGDGNSGARMVFRYNDISNSRAGNFHGNDSQAVSIFSAEIYNNKFALDDGYNISTAFSVRGGTSLVHNNELSGSYPYLGDLQSYRSCPSFYGTHTGAMSSTTLTDGNLTARCGGFGFHGVPVARQNDPYCISASGITTNYYLNNQTTGAWCNIASWTADTINCGTSLPYGPMQGGKRGGIEDNTLQPGDVYAVFYFRNPNGACDGLREDVDGDGLNGYPCSQQAGQTFGGLDSNTQARFPVYGWNNRKNGTVTDTWTQYGTMCKRESSVLQLNRDFFNRAPQFGDEGYAFFVGYKPYACPHPLAGSGSCDANIAGQSGYHLKGIDATAPAAPPGLMVK